ncbi:MAG: 2-hydroxyacid dehydrogenase, partial [Myxococcales bacterium]
MEKPRVLITRRLALAPRSVLGAGIEVDQHDAETLLDRAGLLRRVHEVSALLCGPGDRIDKEVLEAAPRLRIVANHAVGYDNVDVPACSGRGVWVTNTPDVLTDATADLTWALILALARRLREGERMIRAGEFHGWAPTMLLGRDLRGRTLGILGYGRIGRAVARRGEGFGMRVLFTSGGGGVPLDELLERSDVLSIHCPLNAKTRHLIGAAELLRMKRGGLLVNTARGPIVDEAALVAALEGRHLG